MKGLQPKRDSSSPANTSSYPSFSDSAYLESLDRVRLVASSLLSAPRKEFERETERLSGLDGDISRGRCVAEPFPGVSDGVGGRDEDCAAFWKISRLGLPLDAPLICWKQKIASQPGIPRVTCPR